MVYTTNLKKQFDSKTVENIQCFFDQFSNYEMDILRNCLPHTSKNDIIQHVVSNYLKERNYKEPVGDEKFKFSWTPEEMAVALLADKATAKPNSILYTSIDNDPKLIRQQYIEFLNWLSNVRNWNVQVELWKIARPLLCHLYLETFRGNHQHHLEHLQVLRNELYEKLRSAHLNDDVDGENRQEIQLADDITETVLDKLQLISSTKDIENYPLVMTFRSCKYNIELSSQAVNALMTYLSNYGHLILLQVIQTWFEIDLAPVVSKTPDKTVDPEELPQTQKRENIPIKVKITEKKDYEAHDAQLYAELQKNITQFEESAQPILVYSIHNYQKNTSVICGAGSPSYKYVAAGFEDSQIRLWQKDCLPVTCVQEYVRPMTYLQYSKPFSKTNPVILRGHSSWVTDLQFLGNSPHLMTVSRDTSLRIWDMEDFQCKAIYLGHNFPIWCLDISVFDMYIATGSQDKTIRLWSPDNSCNLRVFAGHSQDINCVRFHPNALYIASGSTDRTIRIWNTNDASLVRLMQSDESVLTLDFNPDGTHLATAGEDNCITIWDVSSGLKLTELKSHKSHIQKLRWHRNELYSASADGIVNVWSNPTAGSSTKPRVQFQTDSLGVVNIQDIMNQTVCLVRKPYYNVKSYVNIPRHLVEKVSSERKGRRFMWTNHDDRRTCCLRTTKSRRILKRVNKVNSMEEDSSARTTPRKSNSPKKK